MKRSRRSSERSAIRSSSCGCVWDSPRQNASPRIISSNTFKTSSATSGSSEPSPTGQLTEAGIAELLFVRADAGQLAVSQVDQLIAALHGRQPVRDSDQGTGAVHAGDGLRHFTLGLVIERRRRLIEDQHWRIV